MQMQWEILQPDRALVQQLQQHLNCHPIIATVLANRDIAAPDQADAFLRPSLEALPSPMLLDGMEAAVERICHALRHQEKILVFGDYDADGITATSVLVSFLQAAGADVAFHLPHRIEEGYGLLPKHITHLALPQHCKLIITADCGSSSLEAIAAARRFNIDVIVTDHHNPGQQLPEALAVINPKKEGQPSPLNDLAGVGVAFYLSVALRMDLRRQGWWQYREEPNLKAYCDLVAIGTVADMVPLTGVNRVLTRAGLDYLNNHPRPGLQALLEASAIRHLPVSSDDIAYKLAPRINATGRMAHPKFAFDLLNAATVDQARQLAETLNILNKRRQTLENKILNQIVQRLESQPGLLKGHSLLLAGENWHQGVLGIVAAKLAARYYRPVLLLSTREGECKGSGRSIPQVDLFKALGHCRDLLESYGGHRQAAGLTFKSENINKVQAAFETAVTQMLTSQILGPQLSVDCEVRFEQITPRLVDELQPLEPFGADNPAPLFLARDVRVAKAAIVGQRHRRMTLCQETQCGPLLGAIQFNLPEDLPRAAYFDALIFRLQWNRYKGRKEIQLVVESSTV